MTAPRISAVGLCVTERGRCLLDSINLELGAGEVLGVVGPANCGKTTLLRVLATLLAPSSGRLAICGFDAQQARSAARACLAYVAADAAAYRRVRVSEYLEFFALAAENRDPSAVEQALEVAQLSAHAEHPVQALSTAQQQRLQVARALLSDPQVLLLDEAKAALDVQARRGLHELVSDLAALGKTVVLAARSGQELALVCTQLGSLQAGKLLLQRASLLPGGAPAQLDLFRGHEPLPEARRSAASVLRLRIWPLNDVAALNELLALETAIEDVEIAERVRIRHRGGERFVAELVRKLSAAGFDVVGVEQGRESERVPAPTPKSEGRDV